MSFERDARCRHGELNPGGSGGCPECHEEEFGNPFINELRAEQKKYWPAIQWLVELQHFRGRGRSTLLALAFLEQADLHQGSEVSVWDHYPGSYAHARAADVILAHVAEYIRKFAEEYKSWSQKQFHIDRQRATLTRIK